MRVFALSWLAALAVAGFAFVAAPASARAGAPCSYDHSGRPHHCHHTGIIGAHYSPCASCDNRGLFTNTWTQTAVRCGSCQTYVAPAPTCGYVWGCARPTVHRHHPHHIRRSY